MCFGMVRGECREIRQVWAKGGGVSPQVNKFEQVKVEAIGG